MSRSIIKERNKAIRQAWEKEQQLVQEGKGTRDWTKEQQQDILNPDKGKAYDNKGRAFEGQHMKSAAEYPEYQGNPDNIQFLTRDEHLEAHKGSWQNPTNWYYNPITKEFTYFSDGEIIPCKIMELSNPIVDIAVPDSGSDQTEENSAKQEREKSKENQDSPRTERGSPHNKKVFIPKTFVTKGAPKSEDGFVKFLKGAGRFAVKHPLEALEIAGTVIVGAAKIASFISASKSNNIYKSEPSTSSSSSKSDIVAKVADIVEKANRSSPHEHDVTGHKQRYHTKNGVIWKDKAPYHRGGKDS